MENLNYSTDSNEAILKDNGPFKIRISDMGMKGQKIYPFTPASERLIYGQQFMIENKIIKTVFVGVDTVK